MRPTITFPSNLANSYEIVKLAASLADLSDTNEYLKEIEIIAEKYTNSLANNIIKENRINFVIKYVADCCHFMVLDLEDDVSNFKNHSTLLLNLSIYSIKLYIRSNMDIFYIFVKTNVLQNIFHEFNQIDTFYDTLYQYIIQLHLIKLKQANNLTHKKIAGEELDRELLNLNKTYLTLLFNYFCCFDHSIEILESKLTKLTEHLKSIENNLKYVNSAKNLNLTHLIELRLSLEAIDLIKNIIDYSSIITVNVNYVVNQSAIEIKEKLMSEKFLRFYFQTSKLNLAYGNWLFTMSIQFYFDVFFKYLKFDDQKDATIRLFLRDEFLLFNMNICSYHFESYNSLFNTNPANLNQSLSMSHWPICVSFKQFGMVETFFRNIMKFQHQRFCLNNSILNEIKLFLTFHYKNIDQLVKSRLLKPNYIKTILDDFDSNLGELLDQLKLDLRLEDLVELQQIYMKATKLRLNFITTSLL